MYKTKCIDIFTGLLTWMLPERLSGGSGFDWDWGWGWGCASFSAAVLSGHVTEAG